MQNAMWLASVFGPFLAIMGIWMLLYQDSATKVCNSLKATPAALYQGAIINLLLGLFIISQFNVWTAHISVLITLLGWVLTFRGILHLFLPHVWAKICGPDTGWLKFSGIIPLIWGVLLIWYAFFSM